MYPGGVTLAPTLISVRPPQRWSLRDLWGIGFVVLFGSWRFVPPLEDCSARLASIPGDNTAGPLWKTWARLQVNDPNAVELSFPIDSVQTVTSGISEQMMVIFARLTSPICGFNLTALTLTLMTALSLYWLLRFVVRTPIVVATVGAVALAMGPFSYMVLNTHLQWVGAWPLILLIGGGIQSLTRPGPWAALLMGLGFGATLFTEPYMPLAAVAILLLILVIRVVGRYRFETPSSGKNSWSFTKTYLVAVAVAALIASVFVALLTSLSRSTDLNIPVREAAAVQGMLPWEPTTGALLYVSEWMTGTRAEMMRWPTDDIRIFYFAGTFGLIGLGLLIAGRWYSRVGEELASFRPSIWTGVGLFVTGSLLALPARIDVLGWQLPTPTALINSVVPAIRFFWRYEYIALVGLVILGSIGWSIWIRTASTTWRRSLTVGVVAAGVIDVALVTPFVARGFDFEKTPDVYLYLKEANEQAQTGAVELTSDQDVGYTWLTWQVIHETEMKHKNAVPGTPERQVIDALWGFVHPQTPCLASAIGAEYLIRHNSDAVIPAFPSQELVRSFRYADQAGDWPERTRDELEQEAYWYDVDLYRNDLSRTTSAYLSYGQGFEGGTWDGVTGFAVMPGREAYLDVIGVPGSPRIPETVSFSLRVVSEPQEVTVASLEGEILWQGVVLGEWTNVLIRVEEPQLLRITKSGNSAESAVWLGAFGAGDCASGQ